jgi:hypothetical protein
MKVLANRLIGALTTQPLAIALVVVNVLFLLTVTLTLREVAQSMERKDAMIEQCLKGKL